MAPEVMMGERYDDRADIFSFGIVMSELNTHSMPYAHAKSRDGSGHRMPDTAVLQLVAAGRLHAPEVLYHLQTALKDMCTVDENCSHL